MKQRISLQIFIVLLLGSMGCQNSKSVIPNSVAGIWQADDQPWQIVIESDGTISSVVTAMGQNRIRPNETIRVEMIDDQFSTYQAGSFEADYNPVTRKLFVTITMEHINVKIGDDTLEGDSEDLFIGIVSKNGLVWETSWTTFYDYGEKFPMSEEVAGEPLTFHKLLITNEDKPQ